MPRSARPRAARHALRPGRGLLGGVVVCALTALLGTGSITVPGASAAPLSSRAGSAQPTADETPEQGPVPAELIVAPRESVLNRTADQYEFEVLLRNADTSTLPAGTVRLSVVLDPVTSRDELAGDSTHSAVGFAEVAVSQTAPESEQSLTLQVARDDLPLVTKPDGVYVLRATFTPDSPTAAQGGGASTAEGADPELDDSELVVHDPTASLPVVWGSATSTTPVPLTLVVPIVLPESVRGIPSPDELAAVSPALERLLRAAEVEQATLAIDPRIIASIRAYGTAAPSAARSLLTALERSPLPSFLLQFADADPAAQAALNLETLLTPTGLDFVTTLGTFPGTEGSNVPTLDELLTWQGSFTRGWPAHDAVDQATIELLSENAYTSILVDSTNVEGNAPYTPRVKLGSLEALVADSGLGNAARSAVAGASGTERRAGETELSALLALAAETDTPGTVLALDRGASAGAENLPEVLETIGQLPWVDTVREPTAPNPASPVPTTPEEGASDPLESRTVSGSSGAERLDALNSALTRANAVIALAPILEQPEYLEQYQRTRILALFGTGYTEPDVNFAAAAERFRKSDAVMLRGVSVVATDDTQLVGTSSRVPVLLRNTLPFDAKLRVVVAPSSAAIHLPQRRFEDERVAASGSATLLVSVESRISSGESGLVIELQDSAGEQTFYTGTMSLTLRSSIEQIALISLGVASGLLLGFGIFRSIRRRRAAKALPEHTEP